VQKIASSSDVVAELPAWVGGVWRPKGVEWPFHLRWKAGNPAAGRWSGQAHSRRTHAALRHAAVSKDSISKSGQWSSGDKFRSGTWRVTLKGWIRKSRRRRREWYLSF